MSFSTSLAPSHQEQYIFARDNLLFDGMRRGDVSAMNRTTLYDFIGKGIKENISQSASDIGEIGEKGTRMIVSEVSKNVAHSPLTSSSSDIILEPLGWSSSGRWSMNSRSSLVDGIQSDLRIDIEEENPLAIISSQGAYEANEESCTLTTLATLASERSYTMNQRRTDVSKIPLPPSAASFYNGYSQMEVMELCEGIHKLNMYLKTKRDDVNFGVPGRFLHAVMGQDASDVGSVASTILYSFYLNESLKSDQLCTVPIINMKRADLNSHAELKWLLDSCNVDHSSLIFIDEIDLSYYDLFGSLKLVLLNGVKIPDKQEALKESLVEIFNCKKGDLVYPWVDTVSDGEGCSCCTLIAEKFAKTSPNMLSGKGFSRLLLAGILLDTGNLTNPGCTDKDKYIATLLINGAGRFGCNGLYQILRYKMYDVSDLKVGEILRKDFKKWTKIGKAEGAASRVIVSHVGMTSIGISIAQLLADDETLIQEIIFFQQAEKLRLLVIVSGFYDTQKNFKREILVSAESAELMKNVLNFFNSHASQLPLVDLHQPGLRAEMRAFEIYKFTSRRTIERLLEEFGKTSKR